MTLRLVHPAPASPADPSLPPPLLYEHRACLVCGGRTDAEALSTCVSVGDESGHRWCAGSAEPDASADGRLRFATADSIAVLDAWIDAESKRELTEGLAALVNDNRRQRA